MRFYRAIVMSISCQKLEEWLARCRWLKSTRLDEHTQHRLDLLIADLEHDLKDQREFENRYDPGAKRARGAHTPEFGRLRGA